MNDIEDVRIFDEVMRNHRLRGECLNDWERGFCVSLFRKRNSHWTPRQVDKLRQVHEKMFNPTPEGGRNDPPPRKKRARSR